MPEKIAASLAELEAVAAEYAALRERMQDVVMRRDFLIMALYRRGVSYRTIAKAAGLHYTRIQQMAQAAEEVAGNLGMDIPKSTPPKRRAPKNRPQ